MKNIKKILIIVVPLILIIGIVAVYLIINRTQYNEISVKGWHQSDEMFSLGNIETSEFSKSNGEVSFSPEDNEAFLEMMYNSPNYVGKMDVNSVGVIIKDCDCFFYDNAYYAVIVGDGSYYLFPVYTDCGSGVVGLTGRFAYPSMNFYYPDNCLDTIKEMFDEEDSEINYPFEECWYDFEYAVEYYGRFDADMVTIDMEESKVYLPVYNYRNREVLDNVKVEVDYINKQALLISVDE